MNKFEKRTSEKKIAIIHHAMELFGEQGFSNVSIKEIAAKAEVSQVSIYNYFGSKEALVKECAKIMMVDTIQLAKDILASQGTFTKKIEKALSLCDSQINISLHKYLSEKALEDQHFIQLITKEINHLKAEIYSQYIQYGKEEKVIDSQLSEETIQLFIAALNHISLTAPEEDIQKRQGEIVNLFLYGLLGKK